MPIDHRREPSGHPPPGNPRGGAPGDTARDRSPTGGQEEAPGLHGDGTADHAATRAGADRWLAPVIHAAFFLLLGASLFRYLLNHPGQPRTPWVLALSIALALLYVLGPALGPRTYGRAPRRHLVWLGAVVAAWVALVLLAPSFAWCAVPLFYTGLRTLPARAAVPLIAFLTVFVVVAQLQLAKGFDPILVLAPPAVAALATGVFVHMERQAVRQRALIDDLLRTRRELAATERREGTLAERQRLAMEIHDTLAQGLSSQQMLLQAAARTWESDPQGALRHVGTATEIAARSLAEARRFVRDLAPVDLAGGAPLETALRELADREGAQGGPQVRFHLEGTPVPLPDSARSALVRVAQGALANVREHAAAHTTALTLTYLDDQVLLDIADDGHGFTPAPEGQDGAARAPGRVRGYGLPAIRARVRRLGGTLSVESAPGEGTVLSAVIPLTPAVTPGHEPPDGRPEPAVRPDRPEPPEPAS